MKSDLEIAHAGVGDEVCRIVQKVENHCIRV
jgi:hypothetical protein